VSKILEPVAQIEHAFETDHWPKNPSGLCNGWCGVLDCDFWKPKRA
jgi:hypothetical protein